MKDVVNLKDLDGELKKEHAEVQKVMNELNKKGVDYLVDGLTDSGGKVKFWEQAYFLKKLKLKEGMDVLDVGSGGSIFPALLAKRGCNVYVVEKNKARLDAYIPIMEALKVNIKLILGDVNDVLELGIEFDRITCISVLEHNEAPEDLEMMKCFYKLLKANGILGISVDFYRIYMQRKKVDTKVFWWVPPQIYSETKFKEIIRKAHFKYAFKHNWKNWTPEIYGIYTSAAAVLQKKVK